MTGKLLLYLRAGECFEHYILISFRPGGT